MVREWSNELAASAFVAFISMLLLMSWTESISQPNTPAPSIATCAAWGGGLTVGGVLLRARRRVWGLAWMLGTGGSIAAFVAGVAGLAMGWNA